MFYLATAIISSASYFFYNKFNKNDIMEYMFHRTVETYTKIRVTYEIVYKKAKTIMYKDIENEQKIVINDIKLIMENEIITMPVNNEENMTEIYKKITWNNCDQNVKIHICYKYQGQDYRIVFSYGQDLSILTTNIGWLDDGFFNGINEIESNLEKSSDKSEIWELMHQYGGPLGDFYDEIRNKQDASGILTMNMTQTLFDSENQRIQICNILGEQRLIKLN